MKLTKFRRFKVRSKTDYELAWSNTPCKQIQLLSRIKNAKLSENPWSQCVTFALWSAGLLP